MVDALLVLQTSTTQTSTYSGSGLSWPNGNRKPLVARILYSAATNVSGNNSVTFNIDFAPDGSTYQNIGAAAPIALSTTAQAGEIDIPFVTPLMAVPNTAATIRLTATVAGSGSTPTITYSATVGNAMP